MLRLALLGSKATKRELEANEDADAGDHDDALAIVEEQSAAAESQVPAESIASADPKGKGKGKQERWPPRKEKDEGPFLVACEAEPGSPNDQQLAQLDLLTGKPEPDDEVLYVIPMIAPYCAIGGPYTYRAKLTPGTSKKGQAVRQILKMFEVQLDRQALKLLLQAVPENEATSMMMGTCKISMPGMQKLQQVVKKEKKKT